MRGACISAKFSPVLPSDNSFLDDFVSSSSDDDDEPPIGPYSDSSEDDNADNYVRVLRKGKAVRGDDSFVDDDPIMSLTAPGFTQEEDNNADDSPHVSTGFVVSPLASQMPVSPHHSPVAPSDNMASIDEGVEPTAITRDTEIHAAADVPEQSTVRVYKRVGKKKLQTAGQTHNEIKGVVCKELGVTPGMMRAALPVRYHMVYQHFFLFFQLLVFVIYVGNISTIDMVTDLFSYGVV
jgi:hypothetical protein